MQVILAGTIKLYIQDKCHIKNMKQQDDLPVN